MHSGFYDTPLNSKKDLFFLRLLCSLQVFLILFIVISVLIIPFGLTMFGKHIQIESNTHTYLKICGILDLILTFIIVWIGKWYPIIDKEDEKKLT